MKEFLFAIALIGLAFAGLAIRILLLKNGQFRKSCSSVDPTSGKRIGCTCGDSEGACENK